MTVIQIKESSYFSFPASLEANLVYHRATLKAMETSSKTASCWALGGEKGEADTSVHVNKGKIKTDLEPKHTAPKSCSCWFCMTTTMIMVSVNGLCFFPPKL